jgi:virulence-associated protein VapD
VQDTFKVQELGSKITAMTTAIRDVALFRAKQSLAEQFEPISSR